MELKFNSQICTTVEQSRKLLELGLKPKTADMKHIPYSIYAVQKHYNDGFGFEDKCYLPAWSLHRLLCMLHDRKYGYPIMPTTAYDDIIDEIENEIKCGDFNKEYLNK